MTHPDILRRLEIFDNPRRRGRAEKIRRIFADPFDFVLIAGFVAIVYGVSKFNHAAAWIVAGVFLVVLATLASAGRRKPSETPEE